MKWTMLLDFFPHYVLLDIAHKLYTMHLGHLDMRYRLCGHGQPLDLSTAIGDRDTL